MPWNQAHAPLLLLLESFPKRPRTQSEAFQFGGSHKYKQNKPNKSNKLPSFIDRWGCWRSAACDPWKALFN
jgi:hypothetical protein